MGTMKKSIMLLGVFCILSTYFFLPSKAEGDETYPTKTIKFLVPLGAGGISDVVSRKTADLVGKSLGQEIIVENKLGGGGLVSASFLANSKPDGYTIGALVSATFVISPNFTKMDFDPLTAFSPIIQAFCSTQVLVVLANSPIRTIKEFMEEGRKRRITVGVTGLNTQDVAMRRLASEAKLDLKTVPFGGVPAAMVAVMGRQVDAAALGGVEEFLRSGKVRMIACLNEEAKGRYKDIPSLREVGYDINAIGFLGVFGPRGMPDRVQKRLEEEYARALQDPSIRASIDSFGDTICFKNGTDFGNYLKQISEEARKEFKELGLGIYAKDKK